MILCQQRPEKTASWKRQRRNYRLDLEASRPEEAGAALEVVEDERVAEDVGVRVAAEAAGGVVSLLEVGEAVGEGGVDFQQEEVRREEGPPQPEAVGGREEEEP